MPSLVISYWLVQGVTHMLKINENAMLVKAHYSRSLYSEGIFRQVLATHGTYSFSNLFCSTITYHEQCNVGKCILQGELPNVRLLANLNEHDIHTVQTSWKCDHAILQLLS